MKGNTVVVWIAASSILALGCGTSDLSTPIATGIDFQPRHLIACEDDPDCDNLNTNKRYYADYWASSDGSTTDSYYPMYDQGQGPKTPDGQPIESPSAVEISIFQNEANRLQSHPNGLCVSLGQTIGMNIGAVRMFGKAFWSRSQVDTTKTGFVTAFYVPTTGLVAISRRLPDATPQGQARSDADLATSLRHEFAHRMGSIDAPGSNRTAEEWAEMCA